jgi:hypothetical protein
MQACEKVAGHRYSDIKKQLKGIVLTEEKGQDIEARLQISSARIILVDFSF